MIHYTKEGQFLKLGLNFRFTKGGFSFLWAWYDFATQNAVTYRFRLRMHRKPRILWEVNRFNVVDSYLKRNDLSVVHTAILQDMVELRDSIAEPPRTIYASRIYAKSTDLP